MCRFLTARRRSCFCFLSASAVRNTQLALVKGFIAPIIGFRTLSYMLQQTLLKAGGYMGMQASPEDQLPQHRGKPNSQQTPVGGHETPPELQKISLTIRSLERGLPGSLSSPSLLAEIPDCSEADVREAAAQASSAKEEKMQRTMSWNQAPAIVSRMTSWKEAGKDYNAMQVLPITKRFSRCKTLVAPDPHASYSRLIIPASTSYNGTRTICYKVASKASRPGSHDSLCPSEEVC